MQSIPAVSVADVPFGTERLEAEWMSVNVPGLGIILSQRSAMNTGATVPALPSSCQDFLSDNEIQGYACCLNTENGLQRSTMIWC